MRFAYIGNFEPPHSTENYIYKALLHNGHDVLRLLERPENWAGMVKKIEQAEPEVLLWTSTNDYAPPETFGDQIKVLAHCAEAGIPTVGYHLDLWFGLQRAHYVDEKPFFAVDLLCTADGGHQEEWEARGINHVWFPPACESSETEPGVFREELAYDVVFVGSWRGGYHPESTHRIRLISWLRNQTQWNVGLIPPPGQERWEGEKLRDLYASAKIVVGDSCLVPHLPRYWSDRVPRVTGRCGFLLHPYVPGIDLLHPYLQTWEAGDWSGLHDHIAYFLVMDEERQRAAGLNQAHTLAHHLYEHRMTTLVAHLEEQGMIHAEGAETR